VTYSEPHYLFGPFDKETATEKRRLEAVMKMYCKPRRSPTTTYVFKIIKRYRSWIPMIYKVFPQTKFLYIYRNIIPNAKSVLKMANRLNAMKLDKLIRGIHQRIFWKLQTRQMDFIGVPWKKEELEILKRAPWPQGMRYYHLWLTFQQAYLIQLKTEGHPKKPSIKYEDLLEDPGKVITAVFRHCDLSEELVPTALNAMKRDSQRASRILSQRSFTTADDDDRMESSEVLDIANDLGALTLGHDRVTDRGFRLPNNIADIVRNA
jgi:hypothetical protein